MRIDYILKAAAKRMENSGISIDWDSGYSTVSISCAGEDDIFMQGEEADEFIEEIEAMANRCRSMTEYTIALALAEPYAENLLPGSSVHILWSRRDPCGECGQNQFAPQR